MPVLFTVEDPYEVNVLMRALFAAKFHAPDDGPELAGSPILARLCERAIESFITAQEAGLLPGFHASNAAQTRTYYGSLLPDEKIIASVRGHLSVIAAHRGNWSRWSPDERADYIRLVFRPFVAENTLVREMIDSVSDAEPRVAPDCGGIA